MIHLFFINKHCDNLLKANLQVFSMNCIYKMNHYKLLLMIISEITPLNISFYIAFCFFIAEKEKNYI